MPPPSPTVTPTIYNVILAPASSSTNVNILNTVTKNNIGYLDSPVWLASNDDENDDPIGSFQDKLYNKLAQKQFQADTVVRILDANTIKLEKLGLVQLAGITTPKTGGFPACTTTAPDKLILKLLPAKTSVKVKVVEEGSSNGVKRVLILTTKDSVPILVNTALVEAGYAKPVARGQAAAEAMIPGFTQLSTTLNQQAQRNQLGMYEVCDASSGSYQQQSTKTASVKNDFPTNLDEQFEPLQFTTRTQWGPDGGRTVRVENTVVADKSTMPKNPGDTKGCSDFATYEDALKWYERYYPYYGDVAKLDRDGDGVPCPKLPHTTNMEQYRRKVPTSSTKAGS